jgi:tetratricopeptide (TPR) repeat protein
VKIMTSNDDFEEEKDPLNTFFQRRIIEDPNTPQSVKNDLQALMASRLRHGVRLRSRGLLREALQEFETETNRPINTSIDAEIVESAFWQTGNVYRQLGEVEKAIAAYEEALKLTRQYRVGISPYEDLVELYLEQQRFDEAIVLCQESLEIWPSEEMKRLLANATALKSGDSGRVGE